MNKKKLSAFILLLCFVLSGADAFSQVKYWVHFKDKNGTPYSTANPSAFLTAKSILRRVTYHIPFDASDLPVTPSYIAQIDSVQNVRVLYASKWLNGVVVSIPNLTLAATALSTINTFSFVLDTNRVKRYHVKIEPLNPPRANANIETGRTSGNTSGGYNYGGSYWQNEQLNVICLHEAGYRGQGMTIAVLDAGFSNVDTYSVFDSLRNDGRILGTRDFVTGLSNAYFGSDHGTAVVSCMAGNKPGRILGSAPLASFWLLRTEDPTSESISEEYNWIRGAEFADSVGADVLTTSLGYTQFDGDLEDHTYSTLNGKKAPMSIAATIAARKGLLVLNAAGNEGADSWHYISVPGDADSICTVGAIDSLEIVAPFSSVGPTYDNRIKPDLVARGVNSWISDGIYDGFPGNGTSFATPILAGAMACFWQAHREFNNMKVLDTLKKSASNHCIPNNSRGWGTPKMCPLPVILKSSAFLQGKNNHAGIKIKFIAESPTAHTDSVFTNANGSYSISLSNGAYNVVFSKANFENHLYNNNSPAVFDICSGITTVTLSSSIVPGEIDFDFSAYADATKNQMTVLLTAAGYDSVTIEVYDLAGKLLLSAPSDKNNLQVQFDISNLADEIYLVKVKTSKGTITKKVLKRK